MVKISGNLDTKCKALLTNMSLLEIGPVMFGGTEKIIEYLRQHGVLAGSNNCARFYAHS